MLLIKKLALTLSIGAMLQAGHDAQAAAAPVIPEPSTDQVMIELAPLAMATAARASPPRAADRIAELGRQVGAQLRLSHSFADSPQRPAAGTAAMRSAAAPARQYQVVKLGRTYTGAELQAVLAKLNSNPAVAKAEADLLLQPSVLPNDPRMAELWGMQNSTASTYGASFVDAWERGTGAGVVVAVIDTGALPHPDLGTLSPASGNFVSAGYSFLHDCRKASTCAPDTPAAQSVIAAQPSAFDYGDFCDSPSNSASICSRAGTASSWHGTHVAGTIAAMANNSVGVAGGAYGAKILPVRILGKGGGYYSDIIEGMQWAAGIHPSIANPTPARVLNMSLGGGGACPAAMQTAINAIVAKGSMVVVAAGNEAGKVGSPANCKNVVAVAATDITGKAAFYTNSGPEVWLAAPGGDTLSVLSTVNNGTTTPDLQSWDYKGKRGTSMATPHVAAAAALLFGARPDMTPASVQVALCAGTTPFPESKCTTSNCGSGILNANKSLRIATGELPMPAGDTCKPKPEPACALPWSPTTTYDVDMRASYEGINYRAKWWTRNLNPAQHSTQWEVWEKIGTCPAP